MKLTPAAATLTVTCPGPGTGSGRSVSTSTSGPPSSATVIASTTPLPCSLAATTCLSRRAAPVPAGRGGVSRRGRARDVEHFTGEGGDFVADPLGVPALGRHQVVDEVDPGERQQDVRVPGRA